MAFTPGKSGNPSGRQKERLCFDTLMMVIKDTDKPRPLRALMETLYDMAIGGDIQAIKEICNRIDGMPVQQQLIDITEAVTVIRAPAIEAATDLWKQKLLTAQTTTSSGNPSQGHKLNS